MGPHFLSFFFTPGTIVLQRVSFTLQENERNKTHELITTKCQSAAGSLFSFLCDHYRSPSLGNSPHSRPRASPLHPGCRSPAFHPHEPMPWIPRAHGVIGKCAVYFTEHNITNVIPSRFIHPGCSFPFFLFSDSSYMSITYFGHFTALCHCLLILLPLPVNPSPQQATFCLFCCFAVTH